MAISTGVRACTHYLCDYPAGECAGYCGRPVRNGDQPMPVANDKPAVWPIVMADMQARHELGRPVRLVTSF